MPISLDEELDALAEVGTLAPKPMSLDEELDSIGSTQVGVEEELDSLSPDVRDSYAPEIEEPSMLEWAADSVKTGVKHTVAEAFTQPGGALGTADWVGKIATDTVTKPMASLVAFPAQAASVIAASGVEDARLLGLPKTAEWIKDYIQDPTANAANRIDKAYQENIQRTEPGSAADTISDVTSLIYAGAKAAAPGIASREAAATEALSKGTTTAKEASSSLQSLGNTLRTARDVAIGESLGGSLPSQNMGSLTSVLAPELSEPETPFDRIVTSPLEGFGIGGVVDRIFTNMFRSSGKYSVKELDKTFQAGEAKRAEQAVDLLDMGYKPDDIIDAAPFEEKAPLARAFDRASYTNNTIGQARVLNTLSDAADTEVVNLEHLWDGRKVIGDGDFAATNTGKIQDRNYTLQRIARGIQDALGIETPDRAFGLGHFVSGMMIQERLGKLSTALFGNIRHATPLSGKQYSDNVMGYVFDSAVGRVKGTLEEIPGVKTFNKLMADAYTNAKVLGRDKNEVKKVLRARDIQDDYTSIGEQLKKAYDEDVTNIFGNGSRKKIVVSYLNKIAQAPDSQTVKILQSELKKYLAATVPDLDKAHRKTLADVSALAAKRLEWSPQEVKDILTTYGSEDWALTLRDDLSALNKFVLSQRVLAGDISQETMDLYIKKHPHYVPAYKERVDLISTAAPSRPRVLDKLRKGSNKTSIDPVLAYGTYLDRAAQRIELSLSINNQLEGYLKYLDDDTFNKIFYERKADVLKGIDKLKNTKAKQWGTAVQELDPDKVGSHMTANFRVNGKNLTLRVRDQDIHNILAYSVFNPKYSGNNAVTAVDKAAVNAQNRNSLAELYDFISGSAREWMTVRNPFFWKGILIKETADKLIHGVGPVAQRMQVMRTLKHLTPADQELYQWFVLNMGTDHRIAWREFDKPVTSAERLEDFWDKISYEVESNPVKKAAGTVEQMWNHLYSGGFAQDIDFAPRLSGFEHYVNDLGMDKETALWLVQNQGVNFGRRGSGGSYTLSALGRELNLPVETLYRIPFFRTFQNAVGNFHTLAAYRTKEMVVGGMVAGAIEGTAQFLLNDQDAPAYKQDNSIVSGRTQVDLPYVGKIFAAPAREIEYALAKAYPEFIDKISKFSKDGGESIRRHIAEDPVGAKIVFLKTVSQVESFYTAPFTVVSTGYDVIFNKNKYGGEITPQYLKDAHPFTQDDRYTAGTNAAIVAGTKTLADWGVQIEPMALEYLVKDTLGAMGKYSLEASDRWMSYMDDTASDPAYMRSVRQKAYLDFIGDDKDFPSTKASTRFGGIYSYAKSVVDEGEDFKNRIAAGTVDEYTYDKWKERTDYEVYKDIYERMKPFQDHIVDIRKHLDGDPPGSGALPGVEKFLKGYGLRSLGNEDKKKVITSFYKEINRLQEDGIRAISSNEHFKDIVALHGENHGWITSLAAKEMIGKAGGQDQGPRYTPLYEVPREPTFTDKAIEEVVGDEVTAIKFREAADSTTVSKRTMLVVAGLESDFGRNTNHSGKAVGVMGIMPETAVALVDMYGAADGITYENMNTPSNQLILSMHLAKETYDRYYNLTGTEPTTTDYYIGHFLGLPDMGKFYTALRDHPEYKAATLLRRQEHDPGKSNPDIFFDGKRERTVEEVYRYIDNKAMVKEEQIDALSGGVSSDVIRDTFKDNP